MNILWISILSLIFWNAKNIFCSEINGCTKTMSYDSVRLSCDGENSLDTVYGDYDEYDGESSSHSISCYTQVFSNGYASSVLDLGTGGCSGNRLFDQIPATFKNVKFYDISNFGVETITSEDLKFEYLQTFTATNNQLTNISGSIFMHTPELKEINLFNNNINRIGGDDFKGADNLETIILSSNLISSLDGDAFSNLIHLTKLNLESNSIKKIEKDTFGKNKQLRALNLRNNPIQRIDEGIFVQLLYSAEVKLSWENIKEFDSSILTKEMKIEYEPYSLEHVRVKYLDKSISTCERGNFAHFTYFNVSNNQLRNVNDVISWLGSPIETLDASSNPLQELNADTFKRFINLKYLNLKDAGLSTFIFPTNGTKLEFLQLEDNPIKRLDENILVLMIKGVDVHYNLNGIVEIDTSYFGESLKIDVNSEEEIIFRVPEHDFQLRYTKDQFNQLTYFNISGNKLENGPQIIGFLGSSIQTLDLSSNFVGKLDANMFKRFNSLLYLNLSNSQLSNFGFTTFYHQNKLKSLDISFNQLKKVDFSLMFRNFKNLELLSLEGNNLTEVDTITRTHFPNLKSLGISKNHFSCHYLAKFLLQWHDLHLFDNPSDQTNIDGVDCRHEDHENVANTKDGIKKDSEKRINSDSEVISSTTMLMDSKNGVQISDSEPNPLLEEMRALKYLLLAMFITMCCGYLVIKAKLIRSIKKRMNRNALVVRDIERDSNTHVIEFVQKNAQN